MTSYEANQKLTSDLNLVLRDAEELLKATADAGSENMKEVRSRLALAVESAKATYDRLKEKTVKAARPQITLSVSIPISPLASPVASRCSSACSWGVAVNPLAAREDESADRSVRPAPKPDRPGRIIRAAITD